MRKQRIRIYIADTTHADKVERIANRVAMYAEEALGTQGSSIIPQTGRWKGEAEPGFIVEVVADDWQWTMRKGTVRQALALYLSGYDMTALITVENLAEVIEAYIEEEETA